MSRNAGNNSSASRKGGNSMWVGILVGILAGVGMAAGVAWYLMKSPSPFTKKEQPAVIKPQPESAKPASPAATEKSATTAGDGKPRFEFYKVLTDKPNATSVAPAKPADKPRAVEKSQPADNKRVAVYEPQILQAGSFSNVNDAEKLKARLALIGVEANIQTANIPDKGVWYRVRVGPYKNPDDLSRTSNFLKQNGVDSTPMRAQ
jgi:cell division protein FtsN